MRATAEDWNRAIGEAFFRRDHAGERVVLAIDEAELFKIARESGLAKRFNLTNPREATDHLCGVVRRQIDRHGWRAGPCKKDKLPPILAVLAVFVLAAFRMEDGESWGRGAYWIRVWELFDSEHAEQLRARHRAGDESQVHPPFKLDHPTFRTLWEALEEWANQRQGGAWGRFELPERRSGPHSSVGLVKSQALLRRADLEDLRPFFERVGLRPRCRLSLDKLRGLLALHRDDSGLFSAHAQRVLADEKRFSVAAEQIARRLERWEGTLEATAEPEAPRRRRRSRYGPWREPGEHFDPVRFVGGLPLNPKTWMAGAGPTLLVEAEILATLARHEAWIDGAPWPLKDGRLGPDRASILNQPGRHEVRVGERRLVLEVAEPRLAAEARQPKPAWWANVASVKASFAWPKPDEDAATGERPSLEGPSLEGPWLEGPWAEGEQWPEGEGAPLARRWVESVLAVRDGRRQVGRREQEDHPLLRQLHAAAAAIKRESKQASRWNTSE